MTLLQMYKVMGDDGAELGLYEPSGTWVVHVDNAFGFSRDGKNWDFIEPLGAFYGAPNQGDVMDGKYIYIGVDISSDVLKADTIATPDFESDAGGDGPGLCVWIAVGPTSAVARTTTQLRTSANGILWTDEDASAPADWSDISGGPFRYSSTASLWIACGSEGSAIGEWDHYWTSSSGTSWTKRTFPVDFEGGGANHDWFVDNGSIAIMCLYHGRIYSSTDLINWTLRATIGSNIIGAIWNPILGAFYAIVHSFTADEKVQRSTDGITWADVVDNDLGDIIASGQIACDPVTGLMYVNKTSTSISYNTADSAVSEDGVSWFPRWARGGNFMQHVPGKYGPVIDETLTITPDPITISDSQSAPTTSEAMLIVQNDTTIDESTTDGGLVNIGKWPTGAEGSISPAGREVKLVQNTGDALNDPGTPAALNTWLSAHQQRRWGYSVASGSLSGTFTLSVRDKITLIEDTNGGVAVSISATSA